MPEHTKLSQTRKVAPFAESGRAKHWWRGIGIVLVLLGLIAALLWHNRYALLERQLSKRLGEMGVNAELEIVSIDKKIALIRDVKIYSDDGQRLQAKEIELHYVFKQALKGQFEKIILREPVVNIVVDADGHLAGDWLPEMPEGETASTLAFPERGIEIESAIVKWRAPFGHGEAKLGANIRSPSRWSLSLDAPNTTLIRDDVTLTFDIHGDVEQSNENAATAIGSLYAHTLNTPQLRAKNTKLDFNMSFTGQYENKAGVQGWLHFVGDQLDTDIYAAQNMKLELDIDTVFDLESRRFAPSTTHWKGSGIGIKMKDETKRLEQARTLSAYPAMIAAPIATYFADDLPQKLERLLSGFDVYGEGDFVATGNGYEVRFTDKLLVQGGSQNLHITHSTPNAFVYIADIGALTADIDVQWSGERALKIQDLQFRGHTVNGFSLDGMQSLSGRFISETAWLKNIQGQDFRLAPFDVKLSYKQENGKRRVQLKGAIDYDGVLPGGRVKKLKAMGAIMMDMRGDAFTLGFNPSNRIHMQSFVSSSGWRAENLVFSLEPSDDLMETTQNGRALQANLSQLSANITSPAEDRHLEMEIEHIHITTLFKGFPQNWDMAMENVKIRSEDFPSPGTRISSQKSTLHMQLMQNGDISFISKNPYTHIETENVRVPQIAIDLSGSPDDFTASYDADKVEFLGGEIPKLPMRGTARLKAGELTGQAVTDLPLTKDTPIDMSFRSVEGRGTVDIDIPYINFTPSGLQPQHLIPSLRGKLAEVTGPVSAAFHFAFGGGEPIQSYGTTTLDSLDIGTLVGPLKGVSTQLSFSSIFPLKTDGVQSATLAGFDPGLLMENGTLKFEIVPEGIRIDEAIWLVENTGEFAGTPAGKIYIAPMVWRFGDVVNHAAVHIEGIELGTLLEKIGKDNLSATGQVNGILPARVKGVSLNIEDGFLEIKDGGVIRLKAPALNAAGERNEYAGHAMKALENFRYKKMEARLDGPLDGSIHLGMDFEGNNPDVLNGQPFLFNVGVEGELANIARELSKSFNPEEYLRGVLKADKSVGVEGVD